MEVHGAGAEDTLGWRNHLHRKGRKGVKLVERCGRTTAASTESNEQDHCGLSVQSTFCLGPGLLESAYQGCLTHEIHKRGLKVQSEVSLPVKYDGVTLDMGYRLDLLVEDSIILEIKAIEKLLPIHQAQLLSYLKLSGKQLGFLLNFNVLRMKEGIRRVVHNFQE